MARFTLLIISVIVYLNVGIADRVDLIVLQNKAIIAMLKARP
jgi:hypothetical protein